MKVFGEESETHNSVCVLERQVVAARKMGWGGGKEGERLKEMGGGQHVSDAVGGSERRMERRVWVYRLEGLLISFVRTVLGE